MFFAWLITHGKGNFHTRRNGKRNSRDETRGVRATFVEGMPRMAEPHRYTSPTHSPDR
jgi:hypothetical protein